eukprot:CAMPEP_0204344278 /NCGR_PEP_ID=MMETSP0469-20131031/25508_1 /ASSEMBLY_ACC=CAM_ASM_000384 /TAXON_ID=2969 /ORGANISM="Oxyrrhis marina" /LENGTH=48 /DNA_ID= /DNA_START= /DNA_END= /DNA_ORIENTATION=
MTKKVVSDFIGHVTALIGHEVVDCEVQLGCADYIDADRLANRTRRGRW